LIVYGNLLQIAGPKSLCKPFQAITIIAMVQKLYAQCK